MTTIFGRPWDAPICEGATRAPTPVGETCLQCGEEIVAGDSGTIIGCVTDLGSGTFGSEMRPMHKECGLRAVMGSIGHILHTCSCYGGDFEDPPQITQRQSAQLVWAWVQTYGVST